MKHPTEEELIEYRDSGPAGRESISSHLRECSECREELQRIEGVFAALDSMTLPEPDEDFERRVWQRLAPRLPEKKLPWWQGLLQPRRLAATGGMAALVIAAFLTGWYARKGTSTVESAVAGKVRERVLVVAVGEHLGRSEMVLVELVNTEPPKSQKLINIASEQKRAEDLVEENRLYRQTALQEGDAAMASTLEELERVLQDIANSPDEVTPAQFESMQKRIEAKGILFKVRVVNQELQQRQKAPMSSPARNSAANERNKA